MLMSAWASFLLGPTRSVASGSYRTKVSSISHFQNQVKLSLTKVNTMLLTPLLLLPSLTTMVMGLSAPECADGSISVCTCGDGNPPDFSTFPPCDIKKVFNQAFFCLPLTPHFQGKPKCECPGGGGLASKYLRPRPKRPCNPGRWLAFLYQTTDLANPYDQRLKSNPLSNLTQTKLQLAYNLT